ncbi:MAG: hypothetical protein U1D65_19955 [Pseudomonas sp.]|nr:hypothetical protein [Pseudomonas sp.]MDZ4194266.1 hypothetical protein [Pseudomonas sp.]
MAIRIDDHLSSLMENNTLNLRHDIWLWLWLNLKGANLQLEPSRTKGMRDTIANYIQTNNIPVEHIKNERNRTLIPDKEMDWLDGGIRQIEWLKSKGLTLAPTNTLPIPNGLTGKKLLAASIDIWQSDLSHKILVMQDLARSWLEHKKGDAKYKWFEDDKGKVTTAWDWLIKNTTTIPYSQNPFETYDDILIYFDKSKLTSDQTTLYIDRIKKKWSREKYRNNLKDKNQYNFILSDKAIKRLDRIANEHDISRARVIEILIEQEAEKKLYVSEKIRAIKLLNGL